jgi:hypothetical protein
VLLGERVGQRWARDEAEADDDFAQALPCPRLLLECVSELDLREQSRGDENPSELRGWKLGRIHDSKYRPAQPEPESQT